MKDGATNRIFLCVCRICISMDIYIYVIHESGLARISQATKKQEIGGRRRDIPALASKDSIA